MTSKKEAEEKYLEIKKLFNRLSKEICFVTESYYIWRTLTFSRSIPEVGREQAEKNARLLNLCQDFFLTTEQSHLQTFVIGLVKFFDDDSDALSIQGLINEIQKNKIFFTAEIVHKLHHTIANSQEINDTYEPIDQETIKQMRQIRKQHKQLIQNLTNIRKKQFAHTDLIVINSSFVPAEIEFLIRDVQIIYNKLSNTFDFSTTLYDHLKEDSTQSTKNILKNIELAEKYRIEEIKKEYEN